MIAIVVSRADRASQHIGDQLIKLGDWTERDDDSRPDAAGGGTVYEMDGCELREFEQLHIHMDDPVPAFSRPEIISAVVFVSRHSGDTGPLLTAHFTGNFGVAEYGGSPKSVAPAAPTIHSRLVDRFTAHAPSDYEVGIECTHHGPTDLSVPSLFAELGSDDPQWDDPAGAAAVAQAVLDVVSTAELSETDAPAESGETGEPGSQRHLVGFGGGHYVPRFTRILEETSWAIGHIASDWQLDALGAPESGRDVIQQAFTASRADYAIIEGTHPALRAVIEDLGYRVVSETWVNVVADRPLTVVDAVESSLSSVTDGLRFGTERPPAPADGWKSADPEVVADDLVIHALPDALISRAQGVDLDRTREIIAQHTVAFETEEGGSRVGGRAATVSVTAYEAIITGLVTVLRDHYDSVEREPGAVVAREDTFDPDLAKTRGVPEGPAFGKLAAGTPVDINGDRVTPAQVSRVIEDRFPVDTPNRR
ncbi:MAG: uncharacterized protein conserved in archaea [uncultured archaeon A07HR60]|nr:MAG: uncharacterized protein conserved in archaea [uncultured archaeon A07HR60]